MKKAEEFGRDDKLWISESLGGGVQVTMLWSTIWEELEPFIRTESRIISNNVSAIDKILKGKTSWRTCYNSMQKKKLLEGNKIRFQRG